jgi:hypothetical protein
LTQEKEKKKKTEELKGQPRLKNGNLLLLLKTISMRPTKRGIP